MHTARHRAIDTAMHTALDAAIHTGMHMEIDTGKHTAIHTAGHTPNLRQPHMRAYILYIYMARHTAMDTIPAANEEHTWLTGFRRERQFRQNRCTHARTLYNKCRISRALSVKHPSAWLPLAKNPADHFKCSQPLQHSPMLSLSLSLSF